MILLLSQTFSKWVVILDYNINKTYIAKNLCENRTRPQMHCNGNCVLMKKIRAQGKQEAPSGVINWGKSVQLFVNKISVFSCLPLNKPGEKSLVQNTPLYKEDFAHSIFHPPLV
jgi:hypothetical protein